MDYETVMCVVVDDKSMQCYFQFILKVKSKQLGIIGGFLSSGFFALSMFIQS